MALQAQGCKHGGGWRSGADEQRAGDGQGYYCQWWKPSPFQSWYFWFQNPLLKHPACQMDADIHTYQPVVQGPGFRATDANPNTLAVQPGTGVQMVWVAPLPPALGTLLLPRRKHHGPQGSLLGLLQAALWVHCHHPAEALPPTLVNRQPDIRATCPTCTRRLLSRLPAAFSLSSS